GLRRRALPCGNDRRCWRGPAASRAGPIASSRWGDLREGPGRTRVPRSWRSSELPDAAHAAKDELRPGLAAMQLGRSARPDRRELFQVRAFFRAHPLAFHQGNTGGPALTHNEPRLQRLINHFGTPNIGGTTHLCQWPRDTAGAHYTFGTPALPMPDIARSACIVVWGSNPNGNFLTLATDIAAARARGARLLVVDPR